MGNLFSTDDYVYDDGDDHGSHAQEYVAVDKAGDNAIFASKNAPAGLVGLAPQESHIVKMFNENKMPHAIMFVGPRGVGKGTLALKLAETRLAMVDKPVDNGPSLFEPEPAHDIKLQNLTLPPTHPVAMKVRNGAHPDFLHIGGIYPDDPTRTSSRILIDEVRRVVTFMQLKPSQDNGWRVVFIDNADRMNRAAQNALLKVLEEPPPRTLLILVAHQAGTLLPTIRSRVQQIIFTPLSDSDFDTALRRAGVRVSGTDAAWVRALSDNCPGQAIELASPENLAKINEFFKLWADFPNVHPKDWTLFAENLGVTGVSDDDFRFISRLWLWWLAEMIRAKSDPRTRTALVGLLENSGTGAMAVCDRLSPGTLLSVYDQTRDLFARTLDVALEKRQSILSARMWLTERA